jgi:hypothetical protein
MPSWTRGPAQIGVRDDQSHAYVTREALNELACDPANNSDWQVSLDAMIDYARSRGWVNAPAQVVAPPQRPTLISGRPNVALSGAIQMSDNDAKSQPARSARPVIAAIRGAGHPCMAVSARSPVACGVSS